MQNRISLFAALLIALAIAGCTKSEEDVRKAQRATPDLKLMPANEPGFEAEYVADQSQVKLAAARTVTYEPLDTFRRKSKSKSTDDEAASDEESPKAEERSAKKAGPARGAPQTGAPSGGPGFWTRVGMKGLMGGGPPPGAGAAPPKKPAAKEDKSDKKDKSGDEEESEDEDSGDQESKDSDSDGN